MAMCDACKAIVRNKRAAPGHDALKKIGTRRGPEVFAQAKINLVDYACETCGAKWTYEDDKNDLNAGWSPT